MVQFLSGGSGAAKLVNFVFRVLQFLIAIPIIAIYALEKSQDPTTRDCRFNAVIGDGNLSLAIAAGVISMLTAAIYMGLLVFVDFKWICRLAVWDMIVMILLAATFGQLKKRTFPGSEEFVDIVVRARCGVNADRVRLIQNTTWVDLTAFLLWVVTFLMGLVCLIFGRLRGSKPVY